MKIYNRYSLDIVRYYTGNERINLNKGINYGTKIA